MYIYIYIYSHQSLCLPRLSHYSLFCNNRFGIIYLQLLTYYILTSSTTTTTTITTTYDFDTLTLWHFDTWLLIYLFYFIYSYLLISSSVLICFDLFCFDSFLTIYSQKVTAIFTNIYIERDRLWLVYTIYIYREVHTHSHTRRGDYQSV